MYKNTSVTERAITPLFVAGLSVGVAFLADRKPVLGLSIIGTMLMGSSLVIELTSTRIYRTAIEQYRKSPLASKKSLSNMEILMRPTRLAYALNVFLVVPLVFLAGLAALYTAYHLE